MRKKKLKIGVLMGGPSSEREISLITGRAIISNLDKIKYRISAIEMTLDARFMEINGKKRLPLDFINRDRQRYDLVFIALHGSPGEDGTVQGMFEALNIPYTGSKTLSSALAMNKVFTGQIYLHNGLPHPIFIDIKRDGWKKYRTEVLRDAAKIIKFPAVVKPVDQGSAVGVTIVKDKRELSSALNDTFKKFDWLMIQKFIRGQEGTCGVLEINRKLTALPPTHIKPNLGKFYDYRSKYSKGGSTHICPADFPAAVNKKIQSLASKAHKILRCSGLSRSDFFYGVDKKLWIIETNTIPGMTPVSLFPEAAAKAGIGFSKMLDIIITSAI